MTSHNRQQGFTLIEIALALLVASVGMLGVLGLFPAGVQMSKASYDETQAALFADQVMNGIRAQAATARWDRVRTSINLPPPTPDVWNSPGTLRVTPTAGPDDFRTLRFETPGSMAGGSDAYLDFSIRYSLVINDHPSKPFIKEVYLGVIPSQYGNMQPFRFYMELYNHGQN